MAWRFKPSKYKNAAPKAAKSEEWIKDVSVETYQINGSPITCSAKFMAFNVDAGGTISVLPLDYKGRVPKLHPHIFAHADVVTAMGFSPFDDGLLATGSHDSLHSLDDPDVKAAK
ncbi:hypothetical protein QYM36_010790 [Artemia franciscana]|uniref:DUF1899 domain-containing protein n=1 Tax=Artemia franciscana TaxID=6661 RepID=A0AA88L4G7_ARTSF|nr:hypothetical protein QYM36_010790 [Artemia franciscana]